MIFQIFAYGFLATISTAFIWYIGIVIYFKLKKRLQKNNKDNTKKTSLKEKIILALKKIIYILDRIIKIMTPDKEANNLFKDTISHIGSLVISLKSIVGISAFTFSFGALYIHIITSYYGINNFINISLVDYILYFAQIFFYSYDSSFNYTIFTLVGYFFFLILYFSTADIAFNKNKSKTFFSKLIFYFFFFMGIISIVLYSQILINKGLMNEIKESIKKQLDYHFIIRDNNFLYFQNLKKASVAVVPINSKIIDDKELENATTILKPYPTPLKTKICSYIKDNQKKLDTFKENPKYYKELKKVYCDNKAKKD
ncbi:hypothetical protein IBE48_09590 [Francisella philomiragia]|uniref:Membrane protein n=1 Tax=Francisella philomiragia TaxID=28110 RepID=A0AAW3DCI6_9GAMM|nr:hypothetical protein [Francisella philomiragia]KFJ43313.1 putative membrane protein [Francisella philomiragia]MBK2255700.1 hypothetical protein [Francisella philomiragia]MBK2268404.1 hypothetical protein [Francisella philomiragia]MBK2274014.1 hypothetical protein [Francisella philomiragia]MBK2277855.1 hypothetical protein [Francisella philomiragia]